MKLIAILTSCRYTEIAQRILKCSDMQYTSLTLDKTQQFGTQNALLRRHIYGSYRLLKTVQFLLGHPCKYTTSRVVCLRWKSSLV